MLRTDSIHLFVKRSRGETQQQERQKPKSTRRKVTAPELQTVDPELVRVMRHVIKRFTEVV